MILQDVVYVGRSKHLLPKVPRDPIPDGPWVCVVVSHIRHPEGLLHHARHDVPIDPSLRLDAARRLVQLVLINDGIIQLLLSAHPYPAVMPILALIAPPPRGFDPFSALCRVSVHELVDLLRAQDWMHHDRLG